MRATFFLVPIALAAHAVPSLAASSYVAYSSASTLNFESNNRLTRLLSLPLFLSAPDLATRDFRSSILAARGGAATILEDGAEDAAKAIGKTSIGSTIKGAVADGLGTLLGGGLAGEILGGSNSSCVSHLFFPKPIIAPSRC